MPVARLGAEDLGVDPDTDETERFLRGFLADLWPELALRTESLGFLVVLSAQSSTIPRDQAPELRLSWIRGEGHVVATVHPTPTSAGRSVRVDVPGGMPRLVAEAGVRELRTLTLFGADG
jgi:hypothetical protein